MKASLQVKVRILPSSQIVGVTGRDAWALQQLIKAGPRGCTTIDVPGPRWSQYIFKLRRAGLLIETIDEPHGGPFPGHHARYVLRSLVEVIEETKRAAA